MNKWLKQVLRGLMIAGIVIIILLILVWRQNLALKKKEAETGVIQQQLIIDRNSADRLLIRLENLKKLRDDLVIPQVELRIKI